MGVAKDNVVRESTENKFRQWVAMETSTAPLFLQFFSS